jgi:hypothetical protein
MYDHAIVKKIIAHKFDIKKSSIRLHRMISYIYIHKLPVIVVATNQDQIPEETPLILEVLKY